MGIVLWFTGLSGSGKTTIAQHLSKELQDLKKTVAIFDGDIVRSQFHKHLGFTPEDIKENNRLIAQLCLKNISSFDYIIVPIISPFSSSRELARKAIGSSFIEVYIQTSLEECIRRDVKGLYAKALRGKIPNFIGIDPNIPYQPPLSPEITINTTQTSPSQAISLILGKIGLYP